jgi:dienelactone hydrolase
MIVSLLAAAAGAQLPPPMASSCAIAAEVGKGETISKSVTATDLMHLRDIGGGIIDEGTPFTLSPDGTRIAVAVRQAAVETNSYCTELMLVDLRLSAARKLDAIDGNILLERGDFAGKLAGYGSGGTRSLIARWSPDGSMLAFLEKRDGIDQVMLLPSDGGAGRRQLTTSPVDVRDFRWNADGSAIEFTSRPEAARQEASIVAEGRTGYRYDERWVPLWKFRPFTPATSEHLFSVGIATGEVDERAYRPFDDQTAQAPAGDLGGKVAIRSQDTRFVNSPGEIVFHKSGNEFTCKDAICANAQAAWVRPGTDDIYFRRRTGWSNSLTQIVHWTPKTGATRVLLETDDSIAGCEPAPNDLICAIEGTSQPRRLERVDYRSGTRSILFDPNPEWQKKEKFEVRPLEWRNAEGSEWFAKLLLPPKRKAAACNLPMIIVGYQNQGFARGGSGDYFPILPFVSEGYAVLFYQLPKPKGFDIPVKNWDEVTRRDMAERGEYKSFHSAIETIIDRLAGEGLIDRDRIGITGFSAGTARGAYSLVHGSKFRAASFIACCGGPISRAMFLGPIGSEMFRNMGYPTLAGDASQGANDFDLAPNAASISTPILSQVGDREFLSVLEGIEALRRHGKAADIYVYPDEYHIIWQPVHRLAAYARSMAWFDHHLRGITNPWAAKFLEEGNVENRQ